MGRIAILNILAGLGVVTLVACGSDADDAADPTAPTRPVTASLGGALSATDGSRPDRGRPEGSSTTPQTVAHRGQAMGWLPEDTLVALRIPPRKGEPSFEGTALWQAMANLELGELSGFLGQRWREAMAQIREETPSLAAILELSQQLEGEMVVALVKVFPTALLAPGSDEMPVSVAAWLELGGQEDAARRLLQELGADPAMGLHAVGPDRYRWDEEGARLDLCLEDGWLGAHLGPKGGAMDHLDAWRALEPGESFLASEVVRAAPGVEVPRERTYLEAFLNLEPVWTMARAFAPPEVQAVLGTTRLNHIRGISSISVIDGVAFRDVVTVHNPEHDDILSGMLDFPALDPTWSHAIYRDAESGGVAVLDLSQAWRALREHLPEDLRQELDQSVRMMESMAGINLARDVLGNLGPHYAYASKGDLISAANGGTFEASVVIQVANPKVLRSLLDRMLQDSGLLPLRRAYKVGTTNYYSFSNAIADAPPWLELSYGFLDNALVLSTSPRTFEKTVLAIEDRGESTPGSFRPVFENPPAGTGSISVQSCVAQVKSLFDAMVPVMDTLTRIPGGEPSAPLVANLGIPSWPDLERALYRLPNSVTTLARVTDGYRLESHTAIPSLWLAGAPAAVAASIALPNLLQARTEANEIAVEGALRNLVLAEHQFQATAASDRDGDGIGEFGFFGEMAGATTLASGRTLSPPILPSTFQPSEQGRAEAYGYLFEVYLTGPVGEPIGMFDRNGNAARVDPDGAERGFVVYAWPLEVGATGTRAFVIDECGELFFTRNDDPMQAYSGQQRAPRPDASFLRARSIVDRGTRSVRRGQDGLLWLKAD